MNRELENESEFIHQLQNFRHEDHYNIFADIGRIATTKLES